MDTFDNYAARLLTFSIQSWPFRHIKLAPSKLARYGVTCRPGYLECQSCLKCFETSEDYLEADVERLLYMIANHHQENCPYQALSPELLFKVTREFMHTIALQYYQSCLGTLQDRPLELEQLERVPEKLRVVFMEDKVVSNVKVMAIFGWSLKDACLLCKFCGRQLPENEIEEPFNPFQEHRYFCNWANSHPKKTFGYIILIKQLYEQHINPLEPDPIDKHVNLGAVRRQVAQNLERYLNKSKEIKSFLQDIKKINTENQETIKKREKFNLDKYREEICQIQEKARKKVKIQEEEEQKAVPQEELKNDLGEQVEGAHAPIDLEPNILEDDFGSDHKDLVQKKASQNADEQIDIDMGLVGSLNIEDKTLKPQAQPDELKPNEGASEGQQIEIEHPPSGQNPMQDGNDKLEKQSLSKEGLDELLVQSSHFQKAENERNQSIELLQQSARASREIENDEPNIFEEELKHENIENRVPNIMDSQIQQLRPVEEQQAYQEIIVSKQEGEQENDQLDLEAGQPRIGAIEIEEAKGKQTNVESRQEAYENIDPENQINLELIAEKKESEAQTSHKHQCPIAEQEAQDEQDREEQLKMQSYFLQQEKQESQEQQEPHAQLEGQEQFENLRSHQSSSQQQSAENIQQEAQGQAKEQEGNDQEEDVEEGQI